MRITFILNFLLLPLILGSCAWFDSDYKEYKRQKSMGGGYASAGAEASPYNSPNLPAETGSYTPMGTGDYNASRPYYGAESDSSTYRSDGVDSGTGAIHEVVAGDTLWGLGTKYGTTPDAIRRANSLTGDTIVIGQKLRIPAR